MNTAAKPDATSDPTTITDLERATLFFSPIRKVRELAELFVELAGLVEVHAEPAAELEQQVDKARVAAEQARLELEKTANREEGGCTVS